MEFPLSQHLLLKAEGNIFSFVGVGFYLASVPTVVCCLHGAGQRSVTTTTVQQISAAAVISPCLSYTRM